MPRPTSSTTVARPDLGAYVPEFDQSQRNFIAGQVMPDFPVQEKTADYPVVTIESLLETPADIRRRPRSAYARGDWEFENDNYDCGEYGWEEPVDDTEVKLYERYFDVEKLSMFRALGIVRRAKEKRVADMIFNATNFTANAITHEWDDASNAVPIEDVNAGKVAIRDACGLKPNTLIISYSTFLDLGVCDSIIDRIKYTDPKVVRGELTTAQLAMAFGVEQILVGDAVYSSAKKGQDASVSDFWDNEYAMLCVCAKGDIKQPCIGRTFRWVKDCPDNEVVESYREEKIRSDVIRVREHTDEEIILTATAYLLSNVTT